MDPKEYRRVGYVTYLDGFGLPAGTTPPGLAQDLTVSLPYNSSDASPTFGYAGLALAAASANASGLKIGKVVGVLDKFAWEGGLGSPLKLDFYVSQQNAFQIKALQQSALATTKVNALGWWIVDYDQETKMWYEAAFPKGVNAVTGLLHDTDNPGLNVDLTPVPARDGLNVMVYKISLAVAPGANSQHALAFANSSTLQVAKSWGLVVGNLASSNLTGMA